MACCCDGGGGRRDDPEAGFGSDGWAIRRGPCGEAAESAGAVLEPRAGDALVVDPSTVEPGAAAPDSEGFPSLEDACVKTEVVGGFCKGDGSAETGDSCDGKNRASAAALRGDTVVEGSMWTVGLETVALTRSARSSGMNSDSSGDAIVVDVVVVVVVVC